MPLFSLLECNARNYVFGGDFPPCFLYQNSKTESQVSILKIFELFGIQ